MSPSPISVPSSGSGDACPGALRLHSADDGFLARVRIPGGVLDLGQVRALGEAAERLGDGMLHLTSRGNVQLRGLQDGCGGELAERLGAAGLLPSAAHERVRNVVASPLSGLDGGGFVDVRAWLTGLDAALCASSVTPELSGRFLFGLDDGRGDVAGLRPDVLVRGVSSGDAEVSVGEARFRVPFGGAAVAAVAAAEVFVAVAREAVGRVWRVAELDVSAPELTRRLAAHPALTPRGSAPDPAAQSPQGLDLRPPVPRGHDGGGGPGFVAVGVPFGVLEPAQWAVLLGTADREIRLTPWRSVVVPGGNADDLTRAGLVADPASPWNRVAACVGRPGCAKSHADVRHDAAARIDEAHPTLPTYWSGCERRCGHPVGPYVDVVAQPGGGYTTTVPHHTES
ncbi:precorrin-3B synthase [Streptomyces sp. NPDC051684]|uniref:precorrin-3B synthase n=1 Tax=Streptomyces sp. NPDC051684 TaxID=3365670 RepID=UPI0037A14BDD